MKQIDEDEFIKKWEQYKQLYEDRQEALKPIPYLPKPTGEPPMTATEVLARQQMAEKQFYEKPTEVMQKLIQEQVAVMKEKLLVEEELRKKAKEVERIVEETVKANPQMNDSTIEIARTILRMYPRIDKNLDAYEMVVPFILSVAKDVQDLIDNLMPGEWK